MHPRPMQRLGLGVIAVGIVIVAGFALGPDEGVRPDVDHAVAPPGPDVAPPAPPSPTASPMRPMMCLAASPRRHRDPGPPAEDSVGAGPDLESSRPDSEATRELLALLHEQDEVVRAVAEGVDLLLHSRPHDACDAAQRALRVAPDDEHAEALLRLGQRMIGPDPLGPPDRFEILELAEWVECVRQTADLEDLLELSRGAAFRARARAAAEAARPRGDSEVRARANRVLVSMSVRDVPLLDVVRGLRVSSALPIVVARRLVAASPRPMVHRLDAADLPVADVLDMIASPSRWTWSIDEGRVVLDAPEGAPEPPWPRLMYFDVRDLVPSVVYGAHGCWSEPEPVPPPRPVRYRVPERLPTALRAEVAAGAWGPAYGTSLELKGGTLITRAPRAVLDEIAAWLARVRRDPVPSDD